MLRKPGKEARQRATACGPSTRGSPRAAPAAPPRPQRKCWAGARPLLALPDRGTTTVPGRRCAAGTATSTPRPRTSAEELVLEIHRILASGEPEELLQVNYPFTEEAVTQAWKRRVLLLHPDKLRGLDEEARKAGAEALHRMHGAKDELRRRSQERCCQAPAQPQPASKPRCLCSSQNARKYEVAWVLPEVSDPNRPIEKYEVWGPRHFSEEGDAFDLVLLATLPPLQSSFVIVEEAPTQQDVLWAADRVLRTHLPLSVHAVNGAGSSAALMFDLPWKEAFTWLRGTGSVMCPQCFCLSPMRGARSPCASGCGDIPEEARVVIRCPECHGEALWKTGLQEMHCSCCLRSLGLKRAPAHPRGASPVLKHSSRTPAQPPGPPPGCKHDLHNGSPNRSWTYRSGNKRW